MIRLRDLSKSERGFTLIELMIVVLIISILVAIAVPTFLGARRRASDAQAKSHVRAGLVSEKTHISDGSGYTDVYADLSLIEGNLDWGNPDAASRGVVVEDVSSNSQGVVLKSLSTSGTMFCIADTASDFDYSGEGYPINTAGTYYAKRDAASSTSVCTGLIWDVTSAGWS